MKFKKCHLGRSGERPLPLEAASNQLQKFFKTKDCLHPLASAAVCGKKVAAHTIQAKGPLQAIIDESGHCLSFYPATSNKSLEPHRCGWREASTFAGFCARHDGPTFAALETVRFVGSAEQVFLIAYRAQCHEFYQKQGSVRSHDPMRQLVDRGRHPVDQSLIQQTQAEWNVGVKRGFDDAQRNKARMDKELLESRFDCFDRVFVRFNGPMSVVSTGAVTPNRTISGTELQEFEDFSTDLEPLYVGIVRDEDAGAVVFAWRRGDRAPAAFVAELVALPADQLPGAIVQFMFAYIENTYFSWAWWMSLSTQHQAHIRDLARMSDAYDSPWGYTSDLHVPWKVTSVSDNWNAG